MIFPTLLSYYTNPNISIAELSANNWDLAFRCSLSPAELEDWQRLTAFFPMISETADTMVWPHTSSGHFSVKSLYSKLIGGTPTNRFTTIWRAHIPPKVKIFLWQAFKGRVPAANQIRKRNGPGSEHCALCGALEDTNHVFFPLCAG